ncbi:MAG: ribonuclease Y [bacterium]
MNYQPLIMVSFLVLGLVAGYFIRWLLAIKWLSSLENKRKKELLNAENEAQEILLEAKKEAVVLLNEAKEEGKERKTGLDRLESRLISKEENLGKAEQDIKTQREDVTRETEKIQNTKKDILEIRDKIKTELSRVAQLTPEEAKKQLITEMEERNKEEFTGLMQKLIHEREEKLEAKTVEMITSSIQRYARSHVSDITTTVFNLPSEDLKGKIIGREGRNIRTLERLTGVEFIVDETPEAIVISSFDPLRREVARLSLEKLIKDGRIQPAKIEEKVEESKAELEKRMFEIGEEATYEVGVVDLPKEIIHLLGRLHFRTSYGQNVLTHSIEMAHISGMLASELGVNVDIAKKAALVHDIGKAIDHEVQGSHVELGRKILKKYGVSDAVITAMEAHHEEYPFASPEAYIVAAADILSAARPGARRGTIENYIKRLDDLEKLALGFPGVKMVYAVSAGRELRVFVVPEQVDDFRALQLARDIAAKISSEVKFPGEIKVNVIREIRAVEYAR